MAGPTERDHLLQTIEIGTQELKLNGVAAGIGHVLHQANVFGISSSSDDSEFKSRAYFGIAEAGLWDQTIDQRRSLSLLNVLPDDADWAYTVATTGKSLTQEEDFVERGRAVLAKAADMFENVYQAMGDAPLEQRTDVLLRDYFRVAGLQDDAGDKEGARHTTEVIAPHLIKLAEEIDPHIDPHDDNGARGELEDNMSLAISYLGTLDSDNARQLFRNMQFEDVRERTLRLIIEDFSGDLLAVGRVDDALTILSAKGYKPLSLWNEAAALWEAGDEDTVQRFIRSVHAADPGYYGHADIVLAGMGPMVDVLTEAGQDGLIANVFKSLLWKGEADMTPLKKFAYHCGVAGNGDRLAAMADNLSLLDKRQKDALHEAFQMGADRSAQAEASEQA